MAELEKNQSKNQGQLKQKTQEQKPILAAQEVKKLGKFGGFGLLETTIKGANKMNPKKKALKNIFLTESANKGERELLKRKLEVWIKTLEKSDSVADLITHCTEKAKKSRELLNQNLATGIERAAELETNYRSIALFFKNTEHDKVRNVSIMNATMDQLTDLDNSTFIDEVSKEMTHNYDRLDLKNNYSLLVVPGFLKNKQVVDKWARIAHKHRAMLVTDYRHLDSADSVIQLFDSANMTGGEAHKSNVMMGCNYLVGREAYEELGEEEPLYVPPSAALAGKIYNTTMSQVTAGKKFGGINEVGGVSFPLLKSEISSLEKLGLVPMVYEYGNVMAFSAKTLFSGDNIGMQTYSVVRVFDYVTKVLIDFLNRRTFENFNFSNKKDIRKQIVAYLDSIKGPGNLIEKFKILKFDVDPKQKDRVWLDIHLTPYFPAKTYILRMEGTKGDDPDAADWESSFEQQ